MVNGDDTGQALDPDLGAVFDQHIRHEFDNQDVDATMQTMTKEPYVHHVPVMTGGVGYILVSTVSTRTTL